jgi:hypothetical protein
MGGHASQVPPSERTGTIGRNVPPPDSEAETCGGRVSGSMRAGWRALRWCWRKVKKWADDMIEEKRRYVDENGPDPTGWG